MRVVVTGAAGFLGSLVGCWDGNPRSSCTTDSNELFRGSPVVVRKPKRPFDEHLAGFSR
jgi:hypothetical protein